MVTSPICPLGTYWRYLRGFRRDPAHPAGGLRAGPRKGPACPTSQACSCAAASAPSAPERPLPRLPPHAAGRRAPARARLRPVLCELCFGALPEERRLAVRSERVHASERRLAVVPQGRLAARPSGGARRIGARRAPGHRLHRHLRPARADLRLRLRPRRPARVHGPLHARLPAGARQPGRRRRRRALPAARAVRARSTPSCRSPRSTGRAGSSRRSGSGAAGATARWRSTTSSSRGADVTRVELTTFSEPATLVDRIRQLGAAGWVRRQTSKALERLRMIFEEPAARRAQARHDRGLRARRRRPASASAAGPTRRRWTPARAPAGEAS